MKTLEARVVDGRGLANSEAGAKELFATGSSDLLGIFFRGELVHRNVFSDEEQTVGLPSGDSSSMIVLHDPLWRWRRRWSFFSSCPVVNPCCREELSKMLHGTSCRLGALSIIFESSRGLPQYLKSVSL